MRIMKNTKNQTSKLNIDINHFVFNHKKAFLISNVAEIFLILMLLLSLSSDNTLTLQYPREISHERFLRLERENSDHI